MSPFYISPFYEVLTKFNSEISSFKYCTEFSALGLKMSLVQNQWSGFFFYYSY